MAREGYLILDSDLHMMEPDDLWTRYLDEPFRSSNPPRFLSAQQRQLTPSSEDKGKADRIEGIEVIRTDCVADGELEAASDALAEELRGFPPLAQCSAKKLMNDIEDAGLSLAIELEGQCYGRLRSSDDFREGVAAFHQKRRPEFRGK
jgi:enoyl-CoA hydratase/carnithine racemase